MKKMLVLLLGFILVGSLAQAAPTDINVLGIYFNKLIGVAPNLATADHDLVGFVGNRDVADPIYIVLTNPTADGTFVPGVSGDTANDATGVRSVDFTIEITVVGGTLNSDVVLSGISTASWATQAQAATNGTFSLSANFNYPLGVSKCRHLDPLFNDHIFVAYITMDVPAAREVYFKIKPNTGASPSVATNGAADYPVGNSRGGTPGDGGSWDQVVATINDAGGSFIPNTPTTWSAVKALFN
jgi:hypothetical protein